MLELKKIKGETKFLRIEIDSLFQIKIREAFLGFIKYGEIDLKDVLCYLAELAIESDSVMPILGTEDISIPESGSSICTNMVVPYELSDKIDHIKNRLSLNKKEAFILLIKRGYNIYVASRQRAAA